MSSNVVSSLIQLAIALIASGVMVKLMTLRQDRRKILGDANLQEATAASTLSGAALEMVRAAQKAAADSDAKAQRAEEKADRVQQQANHVQGEYNKLWRELNRTKWKVYWLEAREHALSVEIERLGGKVPAMMQPDQGSDEFPPPDDHRNGPDFPMPRRTGDESKQTDWREGDLNEDPDLA